MKRFVHLAMSLAILAPGAIPAIALEETAASPTETPRERVDEVRKARIRQYWENMHQRIDRVIERLSNIADRVESRIEKFEGDGADVTGARDKLEAARTALAETNIDDIDIDAILETDNPREAFKDARDEVKGVVAKIREAHALLIDSVVLLQGVSTAVRENTGGTRESGPAGEDD